MVGSYLKGLSASSTFSGVLGRWLRAYCVAYPVFDVNMEAHGAANQPCRFNVQYFLSMDNR